MNFAHIEQRDAGYWVVIYAGTVVGRHTAQYRAREQADDLNAPPEFDDKDDDES